MLQFKKLAATVIAVPLLSSCMSSGQDRAGSESKLSTVKLDGGFERVENVETIIVAKCPNSKIRFQVHQDSAGKRRWQAIDNGPYSIAKAQLSLLHALGETVGVGFVKCELDGVRNHHEFGVWMLNVDPEQSLNWTYRTMLLKDNQLSVGD